MEIVISKFGRPRKTVEMSEESATVASVLAAHEIALEGLTVLVDNVKGDANTIVRDGQELTLAPKSEGGKA